MTKENIWACMVHDIKLKEDHKVKYLIPIYTEGANGNLPHNFYDVK